MAQIPIFSSMANQLAIDKKILRHWNGHYACKDTNKVNLMLRPTIFELFISSFFLSSQLRQVIDGFADSILISRVPTN